MNPDKLFLCWKGRQSAVRVWARTEHDAAQQFASRKDVGDGSVIRVVRADNIQVFRASVGVAVTPFKDEYLN